MKAVNHFNRILAYTFYSAVALALSLPVLLFNLNSITFGISFSLFSLSLGFIFFIMDKMPKKSSDLFHILTIKYSIDNDKNLEDINHLKIPVVFKAITSVAIYLVTILITIIAIRLHLRFMPVGDLIFTGDYILLMLSIFVFCIFISTVISRVMFKDFDKRLKKDVYNFETQNLD